MQPRRCRGFTAYFSQNWVNVVAAGRFSVLKVLNFFSQIIIISYMRLKFQSLNIMDPQNMSKPIPYCSNLNKIVFWPWEGVFFIEMKNFKNSLLLYALEHLKTNPDFWNSKIGILSPMASYIPQLFCSVWSQGLRCNANWAIICL